MALFESKSRRKRTDYHYHIEPLMIMHPDAIYYIVIGKRSNGKTFSVIELMLKEFISSDEKNKGAIIRRYDDDLKPSNFDSLLEMFTDNDELGNYIEKLTKGKYNDYIYRSRRFYLCYTNENNEVERTSEVFLYCFALTGVEHKKSTSYPNVTNILFDEMLAMGYYLIDEWTLFTNTLSTIVRKDSKAKIFLCGNTINKFDCPYAKEMGLTHFTKMKAGTIDVYHYGNSALKVVVEMCDNPVKKYDSDVYFAFDNPSLKMITEGEWTINIHPHLPSNVSFVYKDIVYTFYIRFAGETVEGNLINVNNELFVFYHPKTTPIDDNNGTRIIYQRESDSAFNVREKMTIDPSPVSKTLMYLLKLNKWFYNDNETGELVASYMRFCGVEIN